MKNSAAVFIGALAGVFFVAGCVSGGKFVPGEPVQERPYVIVYGKEGCPLCEDLKKALARSGVPYVPENIGDEPVREKVRLRLRQAGLPSERLLIPIVDVNGNIAIRPRASAVAGLYRCSNSGSARAACSGEEFSCKECADSAAVP